MKRYLVIFIALFPMINLASAREVDELQDLLQDEFEALSEDFGAALSYRSITPAEHLGLTGFDLGAAITYTELENYKDWQDAVSSSSDLDYVIAPKLYLHKGLPFGIDVGGFVGSSSNSDVDLFGVEVKYALLKGGVAKPAIGLRAAYTQLDGVDQLDMDTTSVDISISKGFVMLTPYAGAGIVWVNSEPQKEASFLDDEDPELSKVFAGLNVNLALLNLAFEADKTGDSTSYSAKVGFRF